MSKPVLYLDLDGVLVDFVRGALRAHGQYIPFPDVRWDFWRQMDGSNGEMTEIEFWKPMGRSFWEHLPWTPEGKNFLALLEAIAGDRIVLLTSPSDNDGAVDGKIAWIKRELPAYTRRFFVGPPKALAASPMKILVDDYGVNVEKFNDEGGRFVLVPRPWNRRFYDTAGRNGEFDPETVAKEVRTLWEILS